MASIVYNLNFTINDKEIADGNASVHYDKKGDLTTYRVDFDQYIHKTVNSLVVS